MCVKRIEAIGKRPICPLQIQPVSQNTNSCQEECYYVHGETDHRYCTTCIRGHLTDSEPYYMVYYHIAAIGYVPRSLACRICSGSLTTVRPISECRLCLVRIRSARIGEREVIVDEEIMPVSTAARVQHDS